MDIRQWLKAQTKYRGKAKINIEETKSVVALIIKDDGTMIQWPLNSDFIPQVEVASTIGALEASHQPITNANAIVTVSDTIWEILGIQATLENDSNVANRALMVHIVEPTITTLLIASRSFETSTIPLTADQEGQIFLPISPSHWTNTHGTVARVADENPLPLELKKFGTITASWTNKEVGDRATMKVKYRKVA